MVTLVADSDLEGQSRVSGIAGQVLLLDLGGVTGMRFLCKNSLSYIIMCYIIYYALRCMHVIFFKVYLN